MDRHPTTGRAVCSKRRRRVTRGPLAWRGRQRERELRVILHQGQLPACLRAAERLARASRFAGEAS